MKLKSIFKILAISPLFFTSSLLAQKNEKKADAETKLETVENLNQIVNVAFGQAKKSDVIGSYSSVRPSDRIKYDNSQWVRDYIGGLLLGVRGSGNIRGFNDEALFVIDGIPGRDVNLLLTTEIEEITVLKDINGAALYGSQGRNGVILITTKRGNANKKHVAVNMNFGVNQNIALPKYLGAGEYMETYNEALRNDGAAEFFTQDRITNTKSGYNPYKYPDVNFYGSDIVRDFTPNANVATEFSGGTDKIKYYVNMAYKYDGNTVKMNPSVNKGSNTFKVRGNIDFKINDYLSSGVDIVTYLSSQKNSHSNLMQAGTTFLSNLYAPLLPVSLVDSTLLANSGNIKQFDGYILGGDNQFKTNTPFADVFAKGRRQTDYKNVQVGNTINLDLRKITKGLSAKTYLSLDYWDVANVTVTNDFNFYQPTWTGDTITALTPLGKPDKKDLSENISNVAYKVRYGFSAQVDYKRTFGDVHHVDATLLGFSNSIMNKDAKQVDIMGHYGVRMNYNLMSKYYISLSGIQNFSTKLPENTKSGFSPSLGLAYVLSNENFLKDANWLDFLRIKFTTGTLKSDLNIDQYYMYQEVYNPNKSTYSWNDSKKSQQVVGSERGRNDNLDFEIRKEMSIGLEAKLFKSLSLEGSLFKNDITNSIVRLTNTVFPSFYGDFIPYSNYNADRYTGFEFGANYSTNFGGLNASIGANILYTEIEVLKRDEIFKYDYQYRTGQSNSAIFGLDANGLYTAEDFDTNGKLLSTLPQPQFGTVRAGDVKYLDKNDDKIIDNTDEHVIGRWDQPFNFSCNLKLNYKNVTLFVLADGQTGGDAMLSSSYYQSSGTEKYSEFIRNRWTMENQNPNAIVPRISAGNGSNNFKTSTFWLYDNSYIRINRAQLTYEFGKNFVKKLGMSDLSIDVAGSNLLQFAKNKEYRELSTNGYPQKRYYTVGLRMTL